MNYQKQIAYITDLHLDEGFPAEPGFDPERNWKRILEDVSARKISDIIVGGDIGTTRIYPVFFEALHSFNLHVTPGNHDHSSEILKYHKNVFIKNGTTTHYGFSDGPFHYIFLDSSRDELGKEQLAWLDKEVEQKKHILLFVHHPILAVDTLVDRKYPLRDREKALSILMKNKAVIRVFCGHYHLEDETAFDQICQTITPAASFQIRRNPGEVEIDTSRFGYRIISIKDLHVRMQTIYFHSPLS